MIGRIYCVETRGECTNAHRCQQNCYRTHPAQQYQPDYEIEHTRVSHRLTPFGYVVAIWVVLMFVIYLYRPA